MYIPPEHLSDISREKHADTLSNYPLPVNRDLLKRVVEEKVGAIWRRKVQVLHVEFIGSGTFHKAYLITLVDTSQLVARIARPFMPHIKTESEIATMAYIRKHTSIPVPEVYYYESNATNVLGAEYILMEKASGVPLSSLPTPYPRKLLHNIAKLILELASSEHHFNAIGSIYHSPTSSSSPNFDIGPIVSWPFFGSSRGLIPSGTGPGYLDRGPFKTTRRYLESCAHREIQAVIMENEGRSKGRRPRTGPFDISSGLQSPQSGSETESRSDGQDDRNDDERGDDSETSISEGSEEDLFYRDYRRHQRVTYLVAHTSAREEAVRSEMCKWLEYCEDELDTMGYKDDGRFWIDLHDLSRENVFVDENDHSKITCVIDWESTTTRPSWQTHHFPSLLHSHPNPHHGLHHPKSSSHQQTPSYTQTPLNPHPPKRLRSHTHSHTHRITNEHIFKEEMAQLPGGRDWLVIEQRGREMRKAHRVAEWDGWEEGLVESVLGVEMDLTGSGAGGGDYFGSALRKGLGGSDVVIPNVEDDGDDEEGVKRHLSSLGDECGGIGGELGRRLGALVLNGSTLNGRSHHSSEDDDDDNQEEESSDDDDDDEGDEGDEILSPLRQSYPPWIQQQRRSTSSSGSPSPPPSRPEESYRSIHRLAPISNGSSTLGDVAAASRKDRLAMFLALNGVAAN